MSDAPSKKFSDALNAVETKLKLNEKPKAPPPDELMREQELICNWLQERGSTHGETFSYGVIDSSYKMMRKMSQDHYEFDINIVFSFELTPIRDAVRPGFVMLRANDNVDHPAVVNGFLDRKALANWLLSIISPRWDCSEFPRNFTVRFNAFRLTCLPVLEFEHSQWPLPLSPGLTANSLSFQALPWYAFPEATRPSDSRTFVVWAPDWERCILDTHRHSYRLLRLLAALGLTSGIKIRDFKYVIRMVMLQEVHNWPRDLGNSMIAFLEAVVARLKEGRLTCFLVDNKNLLSEECDDWLEEYHTSLSNALRDLKNFKNDAICANTNEGGDNRDIEENNNDDTDEEGEGVLEESWDTKLSRLFNGGLN